MSTLPMGKAALLKMVQGFNTNQTTEVSVYIRASIKVMTILNDNINRCFLLLFIYNGIFSAVLTHRQGRL